MGKPHLLVIDDSPEVAALVRLLARRNGQALTVAPSAEAALEILNAAQTFDLLLVDVNLPGMNGVDLCRLLLARASPPVALFVQSELVEDLSSAIEVGVEYALYKDVLTQPTLWKARCDEILCASQECPPVPSPQTQTGPPPSEPPSAQMLDQTLERWLGSYRAGILGVALLTRVRRVLGPDPGFQRLVRSLLDLARRLFGREDTRELRKALAAHLPGVGEDGVSI